MIQNKTVLILGAGASMPFGFPTGKELKREIIEFLKNNNDATRIVENCGYDPKQINSFWDALWKSGKTSIDAFLEWEVKDSNSRTDYLPIGKIAMAAMLLGHEKSEKLFVTEDNWYEYLFDHMNAPFNNFHGNKLEIITFNYDRSLEQYLCEVLHNTPPFPCKEECSKKITSINIYHVYGSLGSLDEIPYGSDPKDPSTVKKCIEKINIIHEEQLEEKILDKCKGILEDAKKIYFLGFGFNQKNLQRLGFSQAKHEGDKWCLSRVALREKEITGTSLYLPLQEKESFVRLHEYFEAAPSLRILQKHELTHRNRGFTHIQEQILYDLNVYDFLSQCVILD